MRRLVFLIVLAGMLIGRFAHAEEPVQRTATWEAVFLTADIKEGGPTFWLDMHLRQRPDLAGSVGSFQGILRPGIGKELRPGLAAWGGYAWVPVLPSGGALANEHELWTQLTWAHSAGRVSVQLRPRLELRLLQDRWDDPGLRGRAFGRAGLQLSGPLSLQVWDEAFFALNNTDWEPRGLDENRSFIGLALKPTPMLKAELGYMNRQLPVATHGPDLTIEHVAVMAIAVSPTPRARTTQ